MFPQSKEMSPEGQLQEVCYMHHIKKLEKYLCSSPNEGLQRNRCQSNKLFIELELKYRHLSP